MCARFVPHPTEVCLAAFNKLNDTLFCLNSVHVIYSVHLRCLVNIKMQDGNYWSARLLYFYMLMVFCWSFRHWWICDCIFIVFMEKASTFKFECTFSFASYIWQSSLAHLVNTEHIPLFPFCLSISILLFNLYLLLEHVWVFSF